jgi:hypothetical protein
MDRRRSFYLASRQDDFDVPPPDEGWVDFTDIPYVTPANDNFLVKDRLSIRCGTLLRRLIALHGLCCPDQMSKVTRFSLPEASQELIAKLVKAGYLQRALRHDPNAITTAIARLREDLRGGGDDEGPAAA